MVDEGFCSPCGLGDRKDLVTGKSVSREALQPALRWETHVGEDLLDEAEVGFLVKLLVKDDDRPRALEAVSSHLHLVHGVRIQDVEPDRGPVRGFGGPEVEVVVLPPGLEEESVVARAEVAQLVDGRQVVLVFEFRLCGEPFGGSVSESRGRWSETDPFWRAGGG